MLESQIESQRSYKRSSLLFYLQVAIRSTGQPVGRLVDITPEGIKLVSEEAIPTDKTFEFRVILPEGFSGGEYLDVDAKCVWSKRTPNPKLFESGFVLIIATDDQTELIENLIAESGFSEY
jgi:PilZ domain